MGYNYNPRRSRNIYDPASDKPFKISRSKVDRCLDRDEIPEAGTDCDYCKYIGAVNEVAAPGPS